MKQLSQAILEVMKESGYVQKQGKNEFHNYKYVMEANVLEQIRPLLIKHGLVLIPSVKGVQFDDRNNTHITVEYSVIHNPSGEILTFNVAGSGGDKGDKGVYKAMTGANKYALLKLFQLATGEDPEHENPEKDREADAKHDLTVMADAIIQFIDMHETEDGLQQYKSANAEKIKRLMHEAPADFERVKNAYNTQINFIKGKGK